MDDIKLFGEPGANGMQFGYECHKCGKTYPLEEGAYYISVPDVRAAAAKHVENACVEKPELWADYPVDNS